MTKNNGSALLITVLIIGTVGAIALALGRLTLSEVKISTSLSDSVIAYYAAEGGLEDGLWRYRENHDIEDPCFGRGQLPGGKYDFSTYCGTDITEESPSQVSRLNLDTGNFVFNLNPTTNPAQAGNRVYNLKVYFKQLSCIGYLPGSNCNSIDDSGENIYKYSLLPDQSKTFDVRNLRNQSGLRINVVNSGITGNWLIEYKYYNDLDMDPILAGAEPTALGPAVSRLINLPPVPPQAIKLVVKLMTDPNATIKPGFVYFGLYSGDMGNSIDTGYTYIDSIGQYGSTQRRLRMTVDRESGNVISMLDYALYAGTSPISQ